MLLRLLVEGPQEVFFRPLVSLSTADMVRTSLACHQLARLLSIDDSEQEHVTLAFKMLSQGTDRSTRQLCATAAELPGEVHLPSLGLPLRIYRQYCAAMKKVKVPEALPFHGPDDVYALIACQQQLSGLVQALERKGRPARKDAANGKALNKPGRGSVMSLGPPVGCLLSTGESWFLVDFALQADAHNVLPACSEWRWLDVPSSAACQSVGYPPSEQTSFQFGVQLQADIALGTCLRPEMRCAVNAPTQSWMLLQAVAATPGKTFAIELAAGDFNAYGHEEDGWYFPREECCTRSSKESSDSSNPSEDAAVDEQDTDQAQVSLTIRVLLRVCSAARINGWRRGRLR